MDTKSGAIRARQPGQKTCSGDPAGLEFVHMQLLQARMGRKEIVSVANCHCHYKILILSTKFSGY